MKFLIKKNKILLSILLLPYLFIFVFGTVRTEYDLLTIGSLSEVGNTIEIDGQINQFGSFNTISVLVFQRPTLLQRFFANHSNVNDVEPISQAVSHLTTAQRNLRGEIHHTYSVQLSIRLAYEYANLIDNNINLVSKLEGLKITLIGPNVSEIQIGDLIVEVNGEAFTSRPPISIGDTITISRNNQLLPVVLTNELAKLLNFVEYWSIDTKNSLPSLRINPTNVQGSSGGLLQTLSNINALIQEDLSRGLKVAGTGTINADGSVGAIGGVRQKVIAAYRQKANILLIGPDNYEEALSVWQSIGSPKSMPLHRVNNLTDAINILININSV